MVSLKISPDEAIRQLNERIDAIQTVERTRYGLDYYDFIRWCSKTWQVIDGIYETGDPHAEEIRTIGLQNCSCNSHLEAQILADAYRSRLLDYIKEIQGPVKTPE
jgi:hypothetical protein